MFNVFSRTWIYGVSGSWLNEVCWHALFRNHMFSWGSSLDGSLRHLKTIRSLFRQYMPLLRESFSISAVTSTGINASKRRFRLKYQQFMYASLNFLIVVVCMSWHIPASLLYSKPRVERVGYWDGDSVDCWRVLSKNGWMGVVDRFWGWFSLRLGIILYLKTSAQISWMHQVGAADERELA